MQIILHFLEDNFLMQLWFVSCLSYLIPGYWIFRNWWKIFWKFLHKLLPGISCLCHTNNILIVEISPVWIHCQPCPSPCLHAISTTQNELTHWKRRWCWTRLRAGGEGGHRGGNGWRASSTQWTWVWANSRRQWRTEEPAVHVLTEPDTTWPPNNNRHHLLSSSCASDVARFWFRNLTKEEKKRREGMNWQGKSCHIKLLPLIY